MQRRQRNNTANTRQRHCMALTGKATATTWQHRHGQDTTSAKACPGKQSKKIARWQGDPLNSLGEMGTEAVTKYAWRDRIMLARSDVSVGGPPRFCPCRLAGANPSISTASRPRHQPSAVWQGRHVQASKRCAQRSAAKYTTKTLKTKAT